jgi:Peptidase family C25/FlgD Ig-like domain/FG-GAP-like repeat
MRKAVLTLLLASIIAVPLWISGQASVRIEVDVPTSPGDLSVTAAGGYTSVSPVSSVSGSFFTLDDVGRPSIPAKIVHVALPDGRSFAGVDASASGSTTLARGVEFALAAPPAPGPDPPSSSVAQSQDALAPYRDGAGFPSEVVRYLGSGTWHGRTIASFAVFPLQVVEGDLVLHADVRLSIDTEPARDSPAPRALRMSAARARDVEARLREWVANDEALATYPPIPRAEHGAFAASAAPSLEGSPVDCIIVVPAALAAPFDALANWKTAKGVPTVVRTVEWIEANYPRGIDRAETVRFFLQDAYTKWGVQWVLLAGDTPEIPPRYLYTAYYYGGTLVPTDLYFACLDGTFNADGDTRFGEQPTDAPDLYAELSVGRLPVSTLVDAANVVAKIMSYETPLDTGYVDKSLFLAEVLFPAPWSPPAAIQLNGGDLAEYVRIRHVQSPSRRVTRLYETPALFAGSLPVTRAIAIDSLNAGYDFVFHVGHGYRFNMHCGDDNIAIPDADALYHPNRFFNLYMSNCTAAAFNFDCLGERLLRNPNGGAVSVIGAVNSSFAEISIDYMEAYAAAVFDGPDPVHIGDAFAASRASRTALAMLGDNSDLWTHYVYALLGDPEMTLWTAPARTPVVSHPTSLVAGTTVVAVGVEVDGLPQANATVCLWKDGEDYQVGTTNAAGQASFALSTQTTGQVRVVVTGRNLVRHESTIAIESAASVLLSLDGLLIDDNRFEGTFGNGDGVIDAGETVDLTPMVRNTGGAASAPAIATLSSAAPFVTVTGGTAAVRGLAAGESALADEAWRVQIAPGAPDEAIADFAVTIAGDTTWSDAFSEVVHAPAFALTSVRTSVDPAAGVPFSLFVSLKNHGTGTANGLRATLSALEAGAAVLSGSLLVGDIAPLAERESASAFQVSEADPTIENHLQLVVTDSYGRTLTRTIELREPLAPAIQSFDASFGVDKMLIKWNASPSSDVAGYRVYRSTSATGPFARATPDVVTHTMFTDAGLAPNTRYYFAVTAVDGSWNESAFSAVGSASTNPPQLAGWPNSLADPSANSPAIGDIDGDGDLEVVVGNNLLYAFQHDGSEVRDGDGQAVTWGVFSGLGRDFIGPAVLAKLDADPGLDIVAAASTTRQVYCFNGDGSVLPGWPRPTIDAVRASVAVGDIDGDGGLEIVAVDQDANLYAWHADGSEVRDGDSNPATDGVFRRLPDTSQMQYQMPALADIDQDGKDEVIIPAQDKKLYVLNEVAADEPGWPRTLPNYPGGGVAVGDIDANGDLEIVVTVRGSGETYALHHNNTQMWVRWLQHNNFFNPSPALADITGDGKLEVLIPGSNGRLYAITPTGADAPGWPVVYSTTINTESSPVVADVTGDGSPDVLLGDEGTFINGWNSGGVPLDGFPLVMKDSVRGTPSIADLDRDGDVEIVAVGYDRTVYVWSLPGAYSDATAPWPMFHANLHRNGLYGFVVPTGVGDTPAAAGLRLEQNYPNPFNPSTSIVYEIPGGPARRVSLVVYDVTGARVRTLEEGAVQPGRHVVAWDGRNQSGAAVGSGVYFYRLATAERALTRKMVLLK